VRTSASDGRRGASTRRSRPKRLGLFRWPLRELSLSACTGSALALEVGVDDFAVSGSTGALADARGAPPPPASGSEARRPLQASGGADQPRSSVGDDAREEADQRIASSLPGMGTGLVGSQLVSRCR